MRLAILAAPNCRQILYAPYENGAHPRSLPMLLSDRFLVQSELAGVRCYAHVLQYLDSERERRRKASSKGRTLLEMSEPRGG